jgi:nucleoid DNA-binding protein
MRGNQPARCVHLCGICCILVARLGTCSYNLRGGSMNKAELVAAIAQKAGISKAIAEKALKGTVEAISDALAKGQAVTLVGFGALACSSGARAKGAIRAPGRRSRSRHARFPSSPRARHSRTWSQGRRQPVEHRREQPRRQRQRRSEGVERLPDAASSARGGGVFC